jgi:hypothetical protein
MSSEIDQPENKEPTKPKSKKSDGSGKGKSAKSKKAAAQDNAPATEGSSAPDVALTSAPDAPDTGTVIRDHEMHQHHVSKILDEVLDEPEEPVTEGRLKHPMWLDVILAFGLLVTVGGFTIGLFKIYVTHTAEQSITQHNYKAAIALLKGVPFPGFFTIPGSDPEELLAQALYLDAMDKLEVDNDVDAALNQLQQIPPGSRFFPLAQEIIEENFEPSATTLQGGTSITEEAPIKAPVEKQPILPELKDATP